MAQQARLFESLRRRSSFKSVKENKANHMVQSHWAL
jgi:hypothetical protein